MATNAIEYFTQYIRDLAEETDGSSVDSNTIKIANAAAKELNKLPQFQSDEPVDDSLLQLAFNIIISYNTKPVDTWNALENASDQALDTLNDMLMNSNTTKKQITLWISSNQPKKSKDKDKKDAGSSDSSEPNELSISIDELEDSMLPTDKKETNTVETKPEPQTEKTEPTKPDVLDTDAVDAELDPELNNELDLLDEPNVGQEEYNEPKEKPQEQPQQPNPVAPAEQPKTQQPAVPQEPQPVKTQEEPNAVPVTNTVPTQPVATPVDNSSNDEIDSSDVEPPTDPRVEYQDVYDMLDRLAINKEQAEEAKRYADQIFDDPSLSSRAYAALTNGESHERERCLIGLLSTANTKLGYKGAAANSSDKMKFNAGTMSQSRPSASVTSALIKPDGFGVKKNAVMWNTPVITDFGFPFINFSSDALLNIIKSKTDDGVKNDNLKKMFKDASKTYGGIWKAIYSNPLTLIKQIASDTGTKCTPNYLKVDGNDLISSESGENISVIPIKYYSIEPQYEGAVTIPRDFLTSFYDVIDYSSASTKTYLKYADGLTAQEFAEEIDQNDGIPPFYILTPKSAKFSKCRVRSGSLLGALMNTIRGRQKCTMVKTIFQGKKGCLAMESDIADLLYADI